MTKKNKADVNKDHAKDEPNLPKKTVQLSYEEALEVVKQDISKIKKERGLKKWCEEKKLSYNALSSLINDKSVRPQPNKILEILIHLGYTGVSLQKVYSYTMEVNFKN